MFSSQEKHKSVEKSVEGVTVVTKEWPYGAVMLDIKKIMGRRLKFSHQTRLKITDFDGDISRATHRGSVVVRIPRGATEYESEIEYPEHDVGGARAQLKVTFR